MRKLLSRLFPGFFGQKGFDWEGKDVARKAVKRYANQPSLCQGRYATRRDLEQRGFSVPNSKFFYP